MSFETWWVTYKLDDDKLFADWGKDAWDAGRAESEAEIAALQSERDALREALEDISQYWNGLENPKATHDACEHNLRVATLALSTSASGEAKCPRCGSHLRHITFPIGANLPYHPCDDAWHVASGEPARKPVELKPRTFTEVAEHFTKVTKPVNWPTDEPDID